MERRIFLRWLAVGAGVTTARVFLPGIPLEGQISSPIHEEIDWRTLPVSVTITYDEINEINEINRAAMKIIMPALADTLFKEYPLTKAFKRAEREGKVVPWRG